jgi:hypothetical protein
MQIRFYLLREAKLIRTFGEPNAALPPEYTLRCFTGLLLPVFLDMVLELATGRLLPQDIHI